MRITFGDTQITLANLVPGIYPVEPFTGLDFSFQAGTREIYLGDESIVLNVTAVPEPATMALFGVGLAAIGWRRRRALRPA